MIKYIDITKTKIYALILGTVCGTVVYNIFCMDFSFVPMNKLKFNNFLESFSYIFYINIKYWIIFCILSFLKYRQKIELFLLFLFSFLISGITVIIITYKNFYLLSEIVFYFFSILSILIMYKSKKSILNYFVSIIIFALGLLIENFLLIK